MCTKISATTPTAYAVLIAQSDPIDQVIFVDFLAATDADIEAFNTFLDSFYLDAELAGATTSGASSTTTEESGPVFVSVTDDTSTISVRVPETWSDVVSEDWEIDGDAIGIALSAAPNVQDFNDTWDTPGVFIGVSEDIASAFTAEEVLDVFDFAENCTYGDRYEYETDALAGAYDVWNDCGDVEGSMFVVLAATPVDAESPMILLYTLLPTAEEAANVFGESGQYPGDCRRRPVRAGHRAGRGAQQPIGHRGGGAPQRAQRARHRLQPRRCRGAGRRADRHRADR